MSSKRLAAQAYHKPMYYPTNSSIVVDENIETFGVLKIIRILYSCLWLLWWCIENYQVETAQQLVNAVLCGTILSLFRSSTQSISARTSTSTIYIIRIYCSVGNGVIEIKRSPAAVLVSAATKRVPETFDSFDPSSEKALQMI